MFDGMRDILGQLLQKVRWVGRSTSLMAVGSIRG